MATLEERKAQLLARLKELDTRLHSIEAELDSHEERDWDDLATEREFDEALEDLGQAGAREIRMIRAALARIRAGDYGICTRCGGEILPARLDTLPHTPLCRHCAAELA